MSNAKALAPNPKRLLWAGFMAILAAGIGFAIRGGILDNWQREFGFTALQLGAIGGAGLTGFCFGILIGGVVVDEIGYGKLVVAAFAFHVISAVVAFAPTAEMDKNTAYLYLYWGTFIFAIANGTLEAVANPLIATLFPEKRTHYLNVLHASWPAGLVIGGAAGWILDDQFQMHWKIQLGLFLIPTAIYGLMFLGQHMPKSEASKQGLSLAEMFKDVGILGGIVICFLVALFCRDALKMGDIPAYGTGAVLLGAIAFITRFSLGSILLFVLFFAHFLVGAVELGTDGWIQNITGNILTSGEGKILFVFTSLLMFALRFSADFLEKRIGLSPVGLLLICALLAAIGLNFVSGIQTFIGAMLALAVYAVGKTFFWPTMLAVASDRFPRSGAVAISIMGAIGAMSGGLIGSPGLGYAKDRFASETLSASHPAIYDEYKSDAPSRFLFFTPVHAMDGKKLGSVTEQIQAAQKANPKDPKGAIESLSEEQKAVYQASISGDRKTLRADSFIPAALAIIYLGLLLYFKALGGYKPVSISPEGKVQSAE